MLPSSLTRTSRDQDGTASMSKDAKADGPAQLPGGNPSGGGKKGMVLGIVVGLLVAAGGGGAAYWKFVMVPKAAAPAGAATHAAADEPADEEEQPKKKKKKRGSIPEDAGMVAFEPFLVNLADEGAQSYLRVTLSLLLDTEEEAKALEGKPVILTRRRSALLEVLATQKAAHLSTAEGKTALKTLIKERIDELDLGMEVYDVLFSDFVVQY